MNKTTHIEHFLWVYMYCVDKSVTFEYNQGNETFFLRTPLEWKGNLTRSNYIIYYVNATPATMHLIFSHSLMCG